VLRGVSRCSWSLGALPRARGAVPASRSANSAEALLSSDPVSSGRRLTSPSYCSLAWRRLGN
jgi:hypothetical protein